MKYLWVGIVEVFVEIATSLVRLDGLRRGYSMHSEDSLLLKQHSESIHLHDTDSQQTIPEGTPVGKGCC